jgi:aerobic-type carbon monoxide dehydrogenase small subunit (CoxS/CutS family)
MVMQLNSWLAEHPQATMDQIDNILDGNICRSALWGWKAKRK